MVLFIKFTLTSSRLHYQISHYLIKINSHKTPYATSHYFCSAPPQHYDFIQWNKKISHLIRTGRLNEAKRVFDSLQHRNTVTWNSMISGYVKNREISKARKLFDEMPQRDIVSWNLMISGYVSCLGSRRYIEEGRLLFDQMPKRDLVSWNTVISGYARNGMMDDALCLFDSLPEKNVVSWNAMITGFLQNGDVLKAIDLFEKMPERDSTSVSALVSGLIQNGKSDKAAQILLRSGNLCAGGTDLVHAYNTLISGYGAAGRIDEARGLFDRIPVIPQQGSQFVRNVVSWNSMIMCYVKVGDLVSARKIFDEMNEKDVISWNTMINGYAHAADLKEASNLFFNMPDPDAHSWNSMISGYAQKGDVEVARGLFDKMPEKNLVSWNSMIAGYEQYGDYEEAIKLFGQMQVEGEKPDKHTLPSVLSACAGLSALYQGMLIHQMVIKTIIADTPIYNSLMTMYSRCGLITPARSVFDEMKVHRDVVSWNAIIGGYAYQGHAMEALMLYKEMERLKVRPTHITFISVLHACGHAGLVDEGRIQFRSMVRDFGIEPQVEHFASLVDILGRHGHLEEAMTLISSMPVEPDRAVWGALLGACRVHNNMDFARIAAKALMKLDPDSSYPYVLLYNMHADAGRWDNAREMRVTMERNGIRKQPGYSWIELHDKVNVFVASDRSHPLADEIHALTKSFDKIIKDLDLIESIC
ncbi:Pentatricopeptide repeat-containing protein [Thalictrum thalictroides]|uniref:Pentatricopeptide repeat-containing protein n=1 Tax=Thalictrum thalictroides TaxID=46969 RepID=A0A7J6VMI8_THATH|nr:Pentatricopeptide repeat-containing protein [Thalictrum thalictroides]